MKLLLSLPLALASLSVIACGAGKPGASATRTGSTASSENVASSSYAPASGAKSSTPGSSAAVADSAQKKRAPVFNVRLLSDADADGGEVSRGLDADDGYIIRYGPAAKPADRAAITTLLVNYFGALAHEEDSRACSLMFLGLENLVAETYSQTSPGQLAGAGMTCAAVLSKVFAGHHRELSEESSLLHVAAVRVRGFGALVVLRFGPKAVRRLSVYSEGGAWRMGTLQAARIG